jgi:hypothetical protein
MPAKAKKIATGGTRRLPPGKDQMLSILPTDLIREVKIAVAEDSIKLSGAVEQSLRDWLAKRKKRKAPV